MDTRGTSRLAGPDRQDDELRERRLGPRIQGGDSKRAIDLGISQYCSLLNARWGQVLRLTEVGIVDLWPPDPRFLSSSLSAAQSSFGPRLGCFLEGCGRCRSTSLVWRLIEELLTSKERATPAEGSTIFLRGSSEYASIVHADHPLCKLL